MAHSFKARLAQSAERKALNLVVVGSSPTVGAFGSALAFNIPARLRTLVQAFVVFPWHLLFAHTRFNYCVSGPWLM